MELHMAQNSPSNATQNPPRKPAGRGQFQKTVMALARTLHIYTTLFAFLGLLLFSVSGFLIHHDNWFIFSKTVSKTVTLPAALVSAPDDKLDKLKIVEQLHILGPISGALHMRDPEAGQPADDGFTLDESTITLRFEGPSRVTDVTIYRKEADNHKPGEVKIDTETRGLTGLLGDLHMGKATGPAWAWVIDLVSLTLCFASLTGILIWTQLSKRRTIGLVCLGLGTAIIVGIYLVFVP